MVFRRQFHGLREVIANHMLKRGPVVFLAIQRRRGSSHWASLLDAVAVQYRVQ
jgi:hypothetical protein